MASTLQTVLPDDLETALASFVGYGSIDSKASLNAAIVDLLDALQSANIDVASLLSALTYKVKGLLEVVIASRNEAAFTFRSRVLKTLQKSTQYPHPIFTTCAKRIGAFLISVPPWIALDQSIMTKYHAFSANMTSTDAPESDYFVNKKEESDQQVPIKPNTVQSGKRHKRASSVSATIQDPGRYPTKSRRASVGVFNQPPSPTVATNRFGTSTALLDELKGCLELYFAACIEDGVEEFAVTNLFELLVPTTAPQKLLAETILESSHPFLDEDYTQSTTKSPPQSTVAFHDIVKYLGDATKPKLGQWPVVVSQRGIKHVRKYISRDKETFARIEDAIRELAMGSFSTSNHVRLMDHDQGIPIFAADVGKSLRLLYHVDFGAPTNSTLESQFIRIFGVFSLGEIDLSFWKAVSAQLGRRGPEYIRRCKSGAGAPILLKRATSAFSPELYPPLEASQWSEHGADIEIDDSQRLELHRILSLEKFVPLSQTFFDTIKRFTETSFMFSVSGPENRIIMHPSSCLVLGRSGTGKTTCMLFRIIGLDIAAKKLGNTLRQVFVTQSRTLARRKPALGLSLLDMDENAEEEGVLPSKFSELDDSHFPLFLTYDQLCKLLEADFDLQFQPSSLPTPKNARARAQQSTIMQPLVSFDYFESTVWPHFNQQVKKGLHPALVYSEFMGIIKGSEAALSSSRGYLGRAQYEQQSNRSLFGDDTDRSRIYTLFESYQKLRPTKAYDVADRVHALMASLQDRGVPGKCIDFLYVDEAQDNLIIDAALLRTLCPNPHGLFFAGDTAQTISVGSAFRFSELKAFLYRLERNDVHVRGGGRPPVDPDFFQLSTNYRSHSGIVNAAAFIVKLLDLYFKHSIDTLAPEVAHVDVDIHKPTFFSSMTNPADFRTLISEPVSNTVGLGARQVIIVRHESAANSLRDAIGRVAVVLTLYESKGMEFNDVLLFNFFTDSPATVTDWRAMFLAQKEGRQFDHRRHSILQSELKSLYVGLTRARERVWVWEESGNGYIIEALLAASNLATVHRGGTIPKIGVSNHDEEWAEQAQQYFAKNLFSEAAFCFQRARMPWWMTVAQTYKDRQEAIRLPEKDPSRFPKFHAIAQAFDRLAQEGRSKEDEESLRLLFANAGECYAVVPDHFPAAVAFLRARKYTEAAYHYRMAGSFDEAVDVVKRYPVDPDVAENVKYTAKFVFTRRKDEISLHKAWKLCDSKDEYLDFLLDHGFGDQRIVFLESITEHEKIAQVLWEAGDYVNAVLRFRQSDDPSSPRQASRCILEGIRSNVHLDTSYGNESDVFSELFTLSRTAILTLEEKAEIKFLRAVVHLDSVQLKRYGQHFLDKQDLRGALLALDAWSQSATLDGMRSMRDDEVAEVLLLCQKYGTVINTLVRTPGFVELPGIQPIFGVSNTSSNEQVRQSQSQEITLQRTVQPCSFVHSLAFVLVNRGDLERSRADPVTLPTNSVDDMIRRALLRRLNAVVERVDELARKSRGFELCQQFLINQQCGGRDEGTCWKDHVMDRDLTIERFNSQFRLHILVISVLNHFTATPGTSDEKARSIKQKIWLSKLFTLCYPSTNKVGCLSDITATLIPEYSWAMPIVQSWLHEVFRSLRPADQVKYFLNNMLITSLLATAFDYSEAVTYLWRGQWSLDPAYAFQNGLIQTNTKPAVGSAIIWLAKGTPTRTYLGIHFLNHVLNTGQVHLDAEIALVFAEEVCAQLILNHYAHNYSEYDYLAMPRSWIVRAFARAQSPQVNGSVPWTVATTLDTFLNILLLKKSAGKLQMRGSPLWEVSYAVRSQAAQRVCRCLALIGQNITGVRPAVLGIFKGLGTVSPLRPEFQRFAQANDWDEVLDALVESIKASAMDELFMIRRDVGYPSLRPRFKPVVCPSETDILSKLRLTQYPPTIALQSEILCPGASQIGSEKQGPGLPGKSAPKKPAVEAPQLESVASTPEDRRSASIIQAFFRRHRRRAGGPIAAVFERLAKKLQERTRGYGLERRLLLCIRGPLPHVLAYLRTFKQRSEDTIQTLNQDMQESSHEDIEELHAQGIEVRRIRDATIRLIKELQPSSGLYFNRRSGTPVSILEIVERVWKIPELVRSLHNFVEFSNDVDYELGVEPILSDWAPWALEVSTSGANERPVFS
ncbi:hypothetical protein M407DRAFT_20439 [Tulasnella calospora MUT 4182]|uniref:UvrD-like helicase ATP-binding domain-containing protein n=1 Tax=Tulasnella calospora MUT 4182 TaxID=1051891 RepID=A0A0C3QQ48_9AGAM|nr:hypothetical protein M407DRAFT_20439 [Tulasnella calospora MUT 4182]